MITRETQYRLVFFGALISFIEEYGYVLKDDIRIQQNAKMRDFLKAAKNLTYKLEKDMAPEAEVLNEEIKKNLFVFEEQFIEQMNKVLGSEEKDV